MTTFPLPARQLPLAMLAAALLVLPGCSGRDSALSEKVARAERAAQRAEEAQAGAERAAQAAKSKLEQLDSASSADFVPVEDIAPEEPVDTAGAEIGPPDPA